MFVETVESVNALHNAKGDQAGKENNEECSGFNDERTHSWSALVLNCNTTEISYRWWNIIIYRCTRHVINDEQNISIHLHVERST